MQNKVALVTGAARGIGKAIVLKLAGEGAKIIAADLDLSLVESIAEELTSQGKICIGQKVNVRNAEEVHEMFKKIRNKVGGVDILVNNAGVRFDNPIENITEGEWNTVIDTILKGSFNCCVEAQRDMVRRGYGKIVNMSSCVPSTLGKGKQTSYAAACEGIKGFTKSLAIELGGYNINVNCIATDFILTEMTLSEIRSEDMYLEDFENIAKAIIAVKRIGTPEDVANVVRFLASDEAKFISGQILYVKGGP